ncbi:MAG: hypothetical protein WC655_21900, partial [Candidatus Hydrogenedentales bacterium]
MKRLVVRGVVWGEGKPSDIVIEHGRVVSVAPAGRAKTDLGSRAAAILPPLFDIQVNGYGGIDL